MPPTRGYLEHKVEVLELRLKQAEAKAQVLRAALSEARDTLEKLMDGGDPSLRWHEGVMRRIEDALGDTPGLVKRLD